MTTLTLDENKNIVIDELVHNNWDDDLLRFDIEEGFVHYVHGLRDAGKEHGIQEIRVEGSGGYEYPYALAIRIETSDSISEDTLNGHLGRLSELVSNFDNKEVVPEAAAWRSKWGE